MKLRHQVYIGIGSNLGDRMTNCTRGLALLSAHKEIDLVRVSKWYETEAMEGGAPSGQPPFLNAAVHITTTLLAEELLEALIGIEAALGRPHPREKGLPRAIDLDILLYDDLAIRMEKLTIPHPELPKRLFVLVPLCDIAPDAVHPASGLRIRDLEARCREGGRTTRITEWAEPSTAE